MGIQCTVLSAAAVVLCALALAALHPACDAAGVRAPRRANQVFARRGSRLQGKASTTLQTKLQPGETPGVVEAARLQVHCNITRWNTLCPALPSQPAKCFACCEAHKAELLAMRCEGPLPDWNYSWADHCAGKPPPPYVPGGTGCTGPQNMTVQCASNYGGLNHACPSSSQPLCYGFVANKAWGHCCAGHVPGPPSPPPPGPFTLSRLGANKTFDGLGAISGGGATSRLLVDYPPTQREQILDYMFKPSFGANLQILKVEIGGDQDTTDGCESSHMHDNATIDMNAGYEWWLMKSAKERNPAIKLYGLPWAFPGWVANDPLTGAHNDSGSPYDHPEQTCRYILEWVRGAKTVHNLFIDYLGVSRLSVVLQ